VSRAFADPSHVRFVADWQAAADYTASVAREGDYVITLGCGNVNLIIPQVLEALQHPAPSSLQPRPGSGE
jgi:UDP-N-acetylmuramate--alanine ligase